MQTGEDSLFPPGAVWRLSSAALLVLAGVVVAALAVVGGDPVTIVIAAVLVALFFGLAFYLFRLSFPARLRGAAVSVSERDVWRGEDLEVRVEVSDATDAEVGLVCIEYYEGFNPGEATRRVPATLHEPAHEEWRPLRAGGGVQTERFTVPANAPFSFRGDVLAYVWTATVRRGRASVDAPVVVHP